MGRLARRLEIEKEFERTGKPFRRHHSRSTLEDYIIEPLLKLCLRATGLYGRGMRNALQPVVRNLLFEFPDLPSQFDGFQILHLSDLHIDALDGLPETIAALLGDVRPDVCLMTGDYRFGIEGSCTEAFAGMRTVLSSVSAEHGIFAILGNHDPCEMAPALQFMGAEMLVNDAAEISRGDESIWVLGVDDPYDFRCADLDQALREVPSDSFKVLLAHTPDLFAQASVAGVHLYLCGHTHAGQVRFPLIGSVIQNSDAPRAYTHGAWNHETMHGYTSAGLGCSLLPVRFNCPPEIVLIELRRAR
jgi:uncharacterized protein